MKYVIFSMISIGTWAIHFLMWKDHYPFIAPFFLLNPRTSFLWSSIFFAITGILVFSFLFYYSSSLREPIFLLYFLHLLLSSLVLFFTFIVASPFFLCFCQTVHFFTLLSINEEISHEQKEKTKWFVPVILWDFYLVLSSISIFFLNNS